MKKITPILNFIIIFTIIFGTIFLSYQKQTVQAATRDINFSLTALPYLSADITAGENVEFGNLTPGTPIAAPATGTILSVDTNAAGGYSVAINDSQADTNSCLLNGDNLTRIPDYAAAIAAPTLWSGKGLGITLVSADHEKAAKWGNGTTYNDAANKYAGIPQNPTVVHTVAEAIGSTDTSKWAYKVDIDNAQKTGVYTGTMVFTVTAILP